MDYDFAKAATEEILKHADDFEWSRQGFGMLRTYFGEGKRYRLNIWDSRLAVPLCSLIHDHPWHFKSIILCGNFRNVRYTMVKERSEHDATHEWQVIHTGPGGGPDGEQGFCTLTPWPVELYGPGSVYHQSSWEVHESQYTDGTITLNDRTRLPDAEHARVFWPVGSKWIDAMPAYCTYEDAHAIIDLALERLRSGK